MNVKNRQLAHMLTNPNEIPLKRLAWAYAFSKRGSEEEQRFRDMLVERIRSGGPLDGGPDVPTADDAP